MSSDNEILPEEVWAAEIAQDEYHEEDDEEIPKKKKKVSHNVIHKPKREKKEGQTSHEPNETTEESDFDEFKQTLEQKESAQPQQIDEEFDQLLDEFEIELQQLDRYALQPIDEEELGFPQVDYYAPQFIEIDQDLKDEIKNMSDLNLFEWVPEIELEEGKAIHQQLPPFPLLVEKSAKQEKAIPPRLYPLFLRQSFDEMTEKRQKDFLQQMRQLFPQILPVKEEPKINKLPKIAKMFKLPLFQDNDDDEDDDDFDNPKFVPPPPLKLPPLEEEDEEDDGFEENRDIEEPLHWLVHDTRSDEQCKKEDAYIARKWKEEEEEYGERIRMEEYRDRRPKPVTFAKEALERGLHNHNESHEIRKIRRVLDGKPVEVPIISKPFYGRTHFDAANADVLVQLFQELLILLFHCIPSLRFDLDLDFIYHKTYLWFSNEEKNKKRFLPIEICCEKCRHKTDSETVIRISKNFYLIRIIDDYISLTNNLKCLRLYRFEINLVLIVRKLHDYCPQLQHLDLTECYGLQQIVIIELCRYYPLMSHLILSSTNLVELMLNTLLDCMRDLKTLNVSSTLIDGQSLEKIPRNLQRLDIRCCPNISAANMINFIKSTKAKEMQHLKVDAFVNKLVFDLLSRRFNSLIVLQIHDSNEIVLSDQDFLRPIARLKKLESLQVGRNIALNNEVFTQITVECTQLRSLSFEFCEYGERRLTDVNLTNLWKYSSKLERLEIMRTPIIGYGFSVNLEHFKSLRYLNLSQCSRLTDEFFPPIVTKTHITYWVLDNCHNLGKGTLDQIIVKANQTNNEMIMASMLSCDFRNLPYLKSKLLPDNLRLTYSSHNAKKYYTFDGKQLKVGRTIEIIKLLD